MNSERLRDVLFTAPKVSKVTQLPKRPVFQAFITPLNSSPFNNDFFDTQPENTGREIPFKNNNNYDQILHFFIIIQERRHLLELLM